MKTSSSLLVAMDDVSSWLLFLVATIKQPISPSPCHMKKMIINDQDDEQLSLSTTQSHQWERKNKNSISVHHIKAHDLVSIGYTITFSNSWYWSRYWYSTPSTRLKLFGGAVFLRSAHLKVQVQWQNWRGRHMKVIVFDISFKSQI